MNILALSSSRSGQSTYLSTAIPFLNDFLGKEKITIAFIPFASTESHQQYFIRVKNALKDFPYNIKMVTAQNGVQLVKESNAIMVGGGNTFKLIHDLYQYNLMKIIEKKVRAGMPYIGWSAGANITGATIATTNDMPIIQPKSFKAFGFFPFQINPHYNNLIIPGFNGETRDERIQEFLHLNKSQKVIGLPEGSGLILKNDQLNFVGHDGGVIFYCKGKIVVKEKIAHQKSLTGLL
ncbi:MAG: dipeptidase PepE [Bacteroidetes bacterium]|nr:dipeptidase PepE [Bacteroidota bacterium]